MINSKNLFDILLTLLKYIFIVIFGMNSFVFFLLVFIPSPSNETIGFLLLSIMFFLFSLFLTDFFKKQASAISKKNLNYKHIIGLYLIVFIGTLLLIPSFTDDSNNLEEKTQFDSLEENLTPEQTVIQFLSLTEHNNWVESLNNRQEANKYLYSDILYSNNELFNSHRNYYEQLNNALNNCEYLENYLTDYCYLENNSLKLLFRTLLDTQHEIIEYDIYNISVIEEGMIMDISVNQLFTSSNESNIQERNEIYRLQNIDNTWKITEVMFSESEETELKKLSSTLNNNSEGFDGLFEILTPIFLNIANMKDHVEFVNEDRRRVTNILSNYRVLQRNVAYGDSKHSNSLALSYIFEEGGFFSSDYLSVQRDASQMFRELFRQAQSFDTIEIVAIKEDFDAYGNREFKHLSSITMSRETYNKIQWNNFDYTRLDEITRVEFYENSFYRDLKELQELLENPLQNRFEGVQTSYYEEHYDIFR